MPVVLHVGGLGRNLAIAHAAIVSTAERRNRQPQVATRQSGSGVPYTRHLGPALAMQLIARSTAEIVNRFGQVSLDCLGSSADLADRSLA